MIALWRSHFLAIENAICATAYIILLLWCFGFGGHQFAVLARTSDAITAASAIAGMCAGLLGFLIAVVTFLLSMADNKNWAVFRLSNSYRIHWGIFKHAMVACFVSTLLSAAALLCLVYAAVPAFLTVTLAAALLWLAFRLCRVLWAIGMIIDAEVAFASNMRKGA